MCSTCCCPEYCSCNTTCCFGFIIPLDIGTVLAVLWVLFSGLTFPLMSLLFWPLNHIMVPSCIVFVAVFVLGSLLLLNLKLKRTIIFKIGIYGVFAAYVVGCLFITIGLNADLKESERALTKCLLEHFDVRVPRHAAFEMLQSIQIVYYTYLFFSYVYCGVVFQMYERKHAKKPPGGESNVVSRKAVAKPAGRSDGAASTLPKPAVEAKVSKEPKGKKTVRIVLPDP